MVQLAVVVFSIALSWQSPSAPPPPGQAPVYSGTDAGVTKPRVLREVKPRYTADAMRAGIQGSVLLDGIVEVDGSLGSIRVRRSLDSTHGLDDEAVRAASQWRFVPAAKDGVAVRMAITIELAFKIGKPADLSPAPFSLPDSFVPADAEAGSPAETDAWQIETASASGLEIHVARPPGYSERGRQGSDLLALKGLADRNTRAISVAAPRSASMLLKQPVPRTSIDEMANRLRQRLTTTHGGDVTRSGQASLNGRLWIWCEVSASFTEPPPEIAAAVTDRIDGLRAWTFYTTEGTQSVSVNFTLLLPHGGSADQRRTDLVDASREFIEVLKRITITTTP
jgi:TonB family protein